jgi:hypothetical protein
MPSTQQQPGGILGASSSSSSSSGSAGSGSNNAAKRLRLKLAEKELKGAVKGKACGDQDGQGLDDEDESRGIGRGNSQRSAVMAVDVESGNFFCRRVLPSVSSSFLRPGSKFVGTQQSGRSTYEVNVELKRVDMESAFICGYLKIEGLTEDNPTIITYFEGEMVSPKHSFYTRRSDWGATEKTDIEHWGRFASWKALGPRVMEPRYVHENFDQRDHVYMRWKEVFLVPDHRVSQIQGASYAGFYYICFDQTNGAISGYYFHQKSDKFQQLELSYVSDSGGYETYEFR